MAEIKIGGRSFNKISEVESCYFDTKRRVTKLRTELKDLERLLKQLVKFFKENGLAIPQEAEPEKTEAGVKTQQESEPAGAGSGVETGTGLAGSPPKNEYKKLGPDS